MVLNCSKIWGTWAPGWWTFGFLIHLDHLQIQHMPQLHLHQKVRLHQNLNQSNCPFPQRR